MRNNDSLSGFPLLHDYQLEGMWSGLPQPGSKSRTKRGRDNWDWRQQVLYAVGHALNEHFGMPLEVRKEVPIQYVLEKWWPKHPTGFESLLHYWDVKNKVSGELSKTCAANQDLLYPIMLYEQFRTTATELEVDISVIIQAAWQLSSNPDSLLIQKFILSYDPKVIEIFHHMVNVFCYYSFGSLPQLIEVHCLLEGKKVRFFPRSDSLRRSMDFVRLLRDSVGDVKEMGGTCNCSSSGNGDAYRSEQAESKGCKENRSKLKDGKPQQVTSILLS